MPQTGEASEPPIVRRADGSLLVDGMLPIDEFEEAVGRKDLRGDAEFETVAGLLIDRLGRLPEVGDRVEIDGVGLEVVDMDERRVDKVLVTLPGPPIGAGSPR